MDLGSGPARRESTPSYVLGPSTGCPRQESPEVGRLAGRGGRVRRCLARYDRRRDGARIDRSRADRRPANGATTKGEVDAGSVAARTARAQQLVQHLHPRPDRHVARDHGPADPAACPRQVHQILLTVYDNMICVVFLGRLRAEHGPAPSASATTSSASAAGSTCLGRSRRSGSSCDVTVALFRLARLSRLARIRRLLGGQAGKDLDQGRPRQPWPVRRLHHGLVRVPRPRRRRASSCSSSRARVAGMPTSRPAATRCGGRS